jgi:Fur family transcriptional regulator, zinc uptake regulator
MLFAAAQYKKPALSHVFAIPRYAATMMAWGSVGPLTDQTGTHRTWYETEPLGEMTTMPRAIFPAPDHDHDRCASAAIAHAESRCAARAQRLTPMRRQVLEALLASHKPLGAYEIIDRLAHNGRPAPITVYRALDFLRENGLVHRIESHNAFVACVHNHDGDDIVVFLICERCGAVGEAPGGTAAEALKASSRAAGFLPKSPLIEIAGICAHCRER